jgi:hypothetical protein
LHLAVKTDYLKPKIQFNPEGSDITGHRQRPPLGTKENTAP